MKFSTFWFVATTTILLLDSGSFVLAAKKIKNRCNAIGNGKGKIKLSDCEENEECAFKKKKCMNAKTAAKSCETIEELLCSGPLSSQFTVLCSLLKKTPLPALTLTVFAPTDRAFGNLLKILGVASAAEVPPKTLTAILMFHVAPGQHLYDELECGEKLPMIGSGSSRTQCLPPGRQQGEDFISQKGHGNHKYDIKPIIIFPDIMACDDSVIHVINEVMLPKSKYLEEN